MNGREPAPDGAQELAAAQEPVDDLDIGLLAGIRDLWDALDPVPANLVEQIQFAMDLESVDVEVMRLTERASLAITRGDEHSRLITFDSDSLTIMIKIDTNADGTIRLDGWLTPPASHPVELRTTGDPLTTESDDGGRFALDRVPPGMAQLVVRTPGTMPDGRGHTVSTPSIVL